jgi:hypothetical protein
LSVVTLLYWDAKSVTMAISELKSAIAATMFMGIIAAVPVGLRLAGTPFFQLQFEAFVFYLPLALLVGYSFYTWWKAKPSAAISKSP